MGEVKIDIELENFVDRAMADQSNGTGVEVRSFKTRALVDTGAVVGMVPQDVVEYLGVPVKETVVVSLADERKCEMSVAEGITIKIGDRSTTVPWLVGPPNSEPLVGQVVLEVLDLVVDCPGQRVLPNPSSPIYPSLKLKSF
ncbi:MAG: hypothetical protein GY719_07245 [bacterium]|nr:hypothetical protein [bacterium]